MRGKLWSGMLCVACAAALLSGLAHGGAVRPADSDEDDLVPTGKGWGERPDPKDNGKASKAKPRSGSGINYHGGPLILGTTNVYYIWYGNWGSNTATSILTDLAQSIGGSPYFNINTTYYDGNSVHVANAVHYGGATSTDTTKYGTSLTDSEIQSIVSDAVSSNKLPKDGNGVYFVLTSAEINESSGFCTQYCGWHTYGNISGTNLKYSFVGNPDRCPSACEAQSTTSPNGNPGADGMASVIAHELEEAVTDPQLNAWYDNRGYENADKCAWTFGSTYPVGSALANMKLGSRDYLIQRNWVNAGTGYCDLKY